MSAKRKNFFFDPAYMDRFNNGDIPTEEVLRDLIDSIAFFKEVADSSKLLKAGLSKTTTDNKVNNIDGSDEAGDSPLGFTTFVKASQLFRLLNATNDTTINIARVRRDSTDSGETDSGQGIKDYVLSVPLDEENLKTILDYRFGIVSQKTELPRELSIDNTDIPVIPGGTDLQALLLAMINSIEALNFVVTSGLNFVDETRMEPGDFCFTLVPPVSSAIPPVSNWSDHWINGGVQNTLNVADYPELFSKIGYNFGGSGAVFVTPALTPVTFGFVKLKVK